MLTCNPAVPPKTAPAAALFVTTVTSFLTVFASSAINVCLPSIGRALHADAILLNWIVTAFLLTSAMFLVPVGRIADVVGRKRIFIVGVVINMATGAAMALSKSAAALVALRAVQGIGGAMIFATSVAILVSSYPPRERGRVIGINTAAVYVGLSAGPPLGGLLVGAFGWQSIFWINLVAGFVILPMVFWKLRDEWKSTDKPGLDLPGSVLYAASLAALLYGFTRFPRPLGFALAAAGLAGIVAFGIIETRVSAPILNIRLLLRNRAFALSNVAAMINYSATFAVGYFLSLYLQNVKGMSAELAGFVLVTQPIIQASLSPLTGRMSDRIEPRILASMGMGLTTIGLIIVAFISASTPLTYVVAAQVLLGAGFALFSSPNTNAVLSAVDRTMLGVANATLGTMRVVGQTFSMAFALLLLSLILGRVAVSPETASRFMAAMRTTFVVFSALCLVGTFASLARGNVRSDAQAP
jgi:MFS family permease